MNRNSNLQNALKKAFEEHTEPLHDAQWDRLNAALGEKKSKRKFFPWIFSLILVIGLSVGAGYWMGNHSQEGPMAKEQAITNPSETDRSQSVTTQKESTKNNPNTNPTESSAFNETSDSRSNASTIGENETKTQETEHQKQGAIPYKKYHNTLKNSIADNNRAKDIADNTTNIAQERNKLNNSSDQPIKTIKENEMNHSAGDEQKAKDDSHNKLSANQENNEKEIVPETTSKDDLASEVKKDGNIFKEDSLKKENNLLVVQKGKDSTADKTKDVVVKKSDVFKRFAIGFTYGVSQAAYKDVVFTKPANMHEDTRALYNESVKQSTSKYTNLFFDIRLIKNISLSLNTGIQYRNVESSEDVAYKYNHVPFREKDGSIAFYFPVIPDTSNPIIFHSKSIKSVKFMSIPLALNYTLPIGSKNEIQIIGGVILNKIVSAKGTTLSVNEAEMVDISNKYSKKISFGYLGGLNYFRQIYKPWWIGIGVQLQQNKTSFNTSYGYINSNINITNYALHLKYKF